LHKPHLLSWNNPVRVFALAALIVCLAFTEYAASNFSLSTRTEASGTFHSYILKLLLLPGQMNLVWHDSSGEKVMQFQFSCLLHLEWILIVQDVRDHLVHFAFIFLCWLTTE